MKRLTLTMVSVLLLAGWARAGMIVYTYDEQHRLAGANYSNQATVTYDYDKADNLTGFTVLTDSQYFKPFLLYFTLLRSDELRRAGVLLDTWPRTDELRPKCYRPG
ncbi:MAG: hypothetical protein V1873_04010 [Verrucomicrobiota bacterium]